MVEEIMKNLESVVAVPTECDRNVSKFLHWPRSSHAFELSKRGRKTIYSRGAWIRQALGSVNRRVWSGR